MTQKTALTESDFERLSSLAKAVKNGSKPERAADLADRLRDSLVFKAEALTEVFVKMNSTVTVQECDGGESYSYKLVFPAEADISRGSISVLSPLGAALLGRKEGESFAYASPGGTVRVRIERVELQD